MIDKDGKVYRGLQAQVAYLTEKVESGSSTPTGPTVDKITALDLATGEAAVTYDANNGATIVKQGQISADGNIFDVAIEDKLPIVPGDNVTIGTTADGKHLKISATGGGGGGGVAGVSSFGGKTGAINVGKNLSMNGNVVNADFQPTPVVLDADANLGTLTANQLATLQANTANPIVKRNEYYYLNDKQYTTDTLVYTHVAYENGKWYNKSITITISTKAWVKNVNEATTVNGKSGAVNLVAGSNVSITSSGNDITIAASGGGGGGGSSDVQQTNGFYPYKVVVNDNPKVGTTYSYKDSNTDYYPSDCSYRQGQMIVDKLGVIYKVTATTMCECVYIPNGIMPRFSIVLPSDVTFPYNGTLTDEQKLMLGTDKLQVIDVQIAAESGLPDYSRHYLCSNDFLNAQHGQYGSTYWAQYDDTKKMKVAFNYDTFTNKTYTISLVEAGGGNNVQQTNGFYQYNAAVTASPTVGNTYSYNNSQIIYPSGCSYFYGQMIIDTNGAIYRVAGSTSCKCVYAPQGGGSSGGGGGCYLHHIVFFNDPGTNAQIEFYSSQSTPFTFDSFKTKLGSKLLYPTGTLSSNGQTYPIGQCSFDSSSDAFSIGGIGADSAVKFTSFSSSEVIEL